MKRCSQRAATARKGVRMMDILRRPDKITVLLMFGRMLSTFAQTETSAWLHRAAALQRYLMYDVPMDQQTLTATHNSYSSDSDPTTHSNFEVVTTQIYNITAQLSCLGVRGLELDLHYIEELAEEGDEDSAIRVCHTSAEAAEQVIQLCESFGWDICEEAGIPNYGNDTGCRSDAPTLRENFEEIAAWVLDQDNINEVVYIKLDSSLDDQDDRVSTIAADVFGEGNIFSPDEWEVFSGGEDWPSPADLVGSGTRVILAGTEPSTLVFDNLNDTKEEIIAAEDFSSGTCSSIDGFPTPSWKRVQGDMVEYLLSRGNITIFSYDPEDDEALTASDAPSVMKCGLTPTFDRLDAELMEATIWSWDVDRPETGFASPRTAVASASTGRWTDTDSDSSAGEKHSFACRHAENRNSWKVVRAANAADNSSTNSISSSSLSSSVGSASNDSFSIRRRRRRRWLSTSGSGYDGEEYIYSDEVEVLFEGMFYEADEACDTLGDDYVFGAPRSAYENYVLILEMENAGVESAWVDYTSEGDSAGASICWTREDEGEYCVAASNNTCRSGSTEVEEIADGEVPMFQIAEWEVDNYTRPSYSALPLVEQLHGWVRISGGNDFDLDDRIYVIGIILSAATVLVFGFIISCCCLPVGHIAAGSKQHHVDGTGFFGFLCPPRCKQGDFLGSGTLAVVIFFTVLTLMGGAAAIYGVQSVDADIVNLWGSLDGMATVMVDSQTRLETILSRMENVEATINDVVTCSGLSTLEGVGNGVSSAKAEVEELAVNSNIGSAGESIQSVNQEIRRTSGMRRGVVYSAGGFVLVLSLLYVLVGFYALGKDDGNGKAGGARMRGPIMMGCLFLPLTLIVILLCWFLFGLSTSLALLTADFCVSPVENTVGVFPNAEDQEVVGYYTTCEGSNVFSETLAVAYLQGMAASDLLSSVDADAFATACPDKVTLSAELASDIDIILDEINNIGYLVRCSNINSYYVEGVEESLCSDAPRKTWCVVCGFAVVSMSLFVVAVSFRLLLQQKEEGLYRVVFAEDLTSDDGELGTLSSDSYPGDGSGSSGGKGAAVRDAINASSLKKNRHLRTVGITVPVGATSAVLAENDFDDESGTGKPRLLTSKPSWSALAVSSAGARAVAGAEAGAGAGAETETRTVASTPTRRAGVTVRAGRARPVEMPLPLRRSRSGGGEGDQMDDDRCQQKAGEVSTNPFVAAEGGGDPEALSRGSFSTSHGRSRRPAASVSDRSPIVSQMSRKSSGGGRSTPHRIGRGDSGLLGAAIQKQPPPHGGDGVFLSSEDEKRRTNEGSRGGSHYNHGLRRSNNSRSRSANDVRHGAMMVPSKIFRSLAGLDDPYEEPPTVIVSRGCTPARTRGGGGVEAPRGTPGAGGVSDSEKMIVTVARPSTVVAGRLHRRGVEHGDAYASHSGVEEDKTMEYGEEVGASRASSGRFPSSNLARVGTSRSSREFRAKREPPARTRSSGQHILAAHPGTWAAFNRDHRKDSVLSATAGVNDFLSGSGGEDGTRRSRHEYHSSRRGRRIGDTSRGGAYSPESSSTASTPWRGHQGRQRMRVRLHPAGEGPSDPRGRHAIGDDGGRATASVTEKHGADEEDLSEREEIKPTVELSLSASNRGGEGGQGQAGGEGTGEGEPRALSRQRAAYARPVMQPRDGVDVGEVTTPETKRTRSRASKASKIRDTAALSRSRSPKGRKGPQGLSSITPHVAAPSTSSGGGDGGDTRREQRRERRHARRTRSPHDGARSRKVSTK